jgi:hypothetical protein
MDCDRTIVFNDNGWIYGGFGKEMGGGSLKGLPQTSKRVWGLNYQMHP